MSIGDLSTGGRVVCAAADKHNDNTKPRHNNFFINKVFAKIMYSAV
jgi:hypothetical protein